MQAHRHFRYRMLGLSLALGMAFGTAAWAAIAPFPAGSRERVCVMAKDTWARRAAGENIETLPSEIRLTIDVHDISAIRNNDNVPQISGPVFLIPGQSIRFPLRSADPVQFAYTLALHTSGQLSIIVEPEPEAAWQRLAAHAQSYTHGERQGTNGREQGAKNRTQGGKGTKSQGGKGMGLGSKGKGLGGKGGAKSQGGASDQGDRDRQGGSR